MISNNDLGWRGFLIAQFVLLLWGAEVLSVLKGFSRKRQVYLLLLVAIGVAGAGYDLGILRFFPVFIRHEPSPEKSLGLRLIKNWGEGLTQIAKLTNGCGLKPLRGPSSSRIQTPSIRIRFLGCTDIVKPLPAMLSAPPDLEEILKNANQMVSLFQKVYSLSPPESLEENMPSVTRGHLRCQGYRSVLA